MHYAKIKTKSNYMGLNGEFLKVISFLGTIVACEVETELGKQTVDFSLSEVVEIRTHKNLFNP